MKLAKILLAGSLVASFAFAEGAFVGIQGGYDHSIDVAANDFDTDLEGGHFTIGVKGGFDFGNYRAYTQYNFKAKDTYAEISSGEDNAKLDVSMHQFLVGADFTPTLSENLKLAVGPYLGYSLLKLKLSGTIDGESGSESENQSGFILGAKLGLIYGFGAGEFEAGIKSDYSWHSAGDSEVDVDVGSFGGYLGYNFKF